MPEVKTVSVTFERKLNMEAYGGNKYESATVACTLWADVKEFEDLAQVMDNLWSMVKTNVRVQSAALRGKPEEAKGHLGLPSEKGTEG